MRMQFSSESRLDDITAALDSYSVELTVQKGAAPLLRHPMHMCSTEHPLVAVTEQRALAPEIDDQVRLRLVRYEPVAVEEETPIEYKTRWPFYVDHPMKVHFTAGTQWWEYSFTPGRTYTERGDDE